MSRIADLLALAAVVAIAGCTPECTAGNNGRPVISENKAEVRPGLDLPDEPPLSLLELGYLVDGGGSVYLPIVRLGKDRVPRHAAPARTTSVLEHGRAAVIAGIADADVPADARTAWHGVELAVDGTCQAHVDGFALRQELGSDAAAGSGSGSGSADDPFADGADLVAHLDACPGGHISRGAALPPAPVALPDSTANANALATLANRDLFDTDPGRRHRSGGGKPPVISLVVVMHPRTRDRFVVVHVTGADRPVKVAPETRFELTGVYQDAGAGDLTRRSVHDRPLETTSAKFMDLHGDGAFEIVSDHVAWSLRGTVLAHRGLGPVSDDKSGSAQR